MRFSSLAELNDRFAIPGVTKLLPGNGGLPKIHITVPSCEAEVYLHGAQVTSWQPTGSPDVIFLSGDSQWAEGRAIRGGIPVCFPWFRNKANDPQAPSHGFVRTKAWELVAISHQSDTVTISLETESDESTRRFWPYDFRLLHRITVGSALQLELAMTNTGRAPLRFEEALHTYHRVGDARKATVSGLDGTTYLDNTDGNKEKVQRGDVIFTQPTDNAYFNTNSTLEILDPTLNRRIRIEKSSSLTTVVWNPWESGAKSLADLGDEEWTQMACVEACNIRANAVDLAPGEIHTMTAKITSVPLSL
jgi:glucose-6-phosphate 1-epimerase